MRLGTVIVFGIAAGFAILTTWAFYKKNNEEQKDPRDADKEDGNGDHRN